MVDDKNDKEGNKLNREFFSLIKKICKKDIKIENSILYRETYLLHQRLHNIKKLSKQKYNEVKSDEFLFYNDQVEINNNNNSTSSTISIKRINLEIQDAFYRFINNICLYFYKGLSLKTMGDDLRRGIYEC